MLDIAALIAALEAAVVTNDPTALAEAHGRLAYDIGDDIGITVATALARAYLERERARMRALGPAILVKCA